MINIYSIPYLNILSDNELGFWTTALSVLILIYSQFEIAKNYSIKGEKFHQCSLEISTLYNQLRMVKTSEFNKKNKKRNLFRHIQKT